MTMICIFISACLMIVSLIFAVLFKVLGMKAVVFLPKYRKIPKDKLEEYCFEKIVDDASDVCITGIFFWLIAACLVFSSVVLYFFVLAGFFVWIGFVLYETPEQLYDTYRRVGYTN